MKKLLLIATLFLMSANLTGAETITFPNPLGGVSTISQLLDKIIDGLILLGAPVLVVVVIWAGFLFLSAGADPGNVEKAKNTILYAVIGYGIILLAKGIGLIINNFISG